MTTQRMRLLCVGASVLAGCASVGPDYVRPAAPVSAAFKEIKGWKEASPRDGLPKGDWWRVFHDPELDRLEEQVAVSNETIAADEANHRASLALVAQARAGLSPTVNFDPSFNRSGPNTDLLNEQASASWTLDIWGKTRRSIERQGDLAEESAANLANARLAAQSALAIAYVSLRQADSLRALLTRTVGEYQRALEIAQNQYNAGTTPQSDVITAKTQLLGAEAQSINVGVARATSEHAIAVLIGRPPAALSIGPGALAQGMPSVPIGIPSELLERRPDVAAAERAMAAQNAAIGVAIAGYYPSLTLNGSAGYSGNPFIKQIAGANPVWSFGLGLAQPLFNGGLTDAQVDEARAAYAAGAAAYKATVLAALQQVEDALSTVRVLGQEEKIQKEAVVSAEQAVQIALNEYRAGTQNFTTVVTAEATALADEQSALTTKAQRLTAAVNLIVALGGGWQKKP